MVPGSGDKCRNISWLVRETAFIDIFAQTYTLFPHHICIVYSLLSLRPHVSMYRKYPVCSMSVNYHKWPCKSFPKVTWTAVQYLHREKLCRCMQ